jgi:metal-responsive CopG/Arc/MetJ family transcriptional regulator
MALKRFQIYMDEQMLDELRKRKKEQGITISESIRRCVEKELKRTKKSR